MQIFARPDPDQVLDLLIASELPASDLQEMAFEHFLGCGSGEQLQGVIGLEVHAPYGLLRSLAVSEQARNQGCGQALVDALEAHACAQGLTALYLLTTTAEAFFARRGYEPVERAQVPGPIRATREFSSLCPASATVMRKALTEQANVQEH